MGGGLQAPLLGDIDSAPGSMHRGYSGGSILQTPFAGIVIPESHEEPFPLEFTADDRRRHHREALFMLTSEQSSKVKITRTETGQPIHPVHQMEAPVKPLTLWGMVAIIFFAVSGGPFGSEEAVASMGPYWVLLGFVILPIVWSIPEGLMTSELSTMFPGNGGYVFWTTAAFGPRMGFMQGFWSWLSNVTNIAVYPHLLHQYMSAEFPVMKLPVIQFSFLTTFTILMSYINFRGLHIIGNGGAIAIVLVLVPFLVLAVVGFPMIDWNELDTGVSYSQITATSLVSFLNIMFWNLNSWENCSVLSGEVAEPQKSLPKAIGIALIITVLSYLVPLTVGIGVMGGIADHSEWKAGFFQNVGYVVGGKPMAWFILFGATFGCIGQYQSILCSSAYSLQALGEIGMLPAAAAVRSKYDTPTIGISVATVIVLSLTTFGFVDIVQLLNSVYCLSLLVEFATLLKLRFTCRKMKRPFKIPLNVFGLFLMILPAVVTVFAMLLVPPLNGDYMTTYYMVGGTIAAVAMYELVELGRRRKWYSFCDVPPRDHVEVVQRLKLF